VEWRGAWWADRSTAGLLCPPTPFGGGGGQQVAGRESERRRGEPSSTRVSSGLTRVSSGLTMVSSGLMSSLVPTYAASGTVCGDIPSDKA
jgi:hypothetical protein